MIVNAPVRPRGSARGALTVTTVKEQEQCEKQGHATLASGCGPAYAL